jgi:hypothetical protein
MERPALRRNLMAVRDGRVRIRRLEGVETESVAVCFRSKDYLDAQVRRLLLALLNAELPPQAQRTRLPKFFGLYLERHGLELVGLAEEPVSNTAHGSGIYGWTKTALIRNLEALWAGRVEIRRLEGGGHWEHNAMTGCGSN